MSTSNADHECKNQLGIILGFVELLLEDTSESQQRRGDLMEIQKAAQRLLELLPQLGGVSGPPLAGA